MITDGVLGASWLPTDGYLDPSLLTYALAEGAREGGCDIHTNTRVTGIDVRGGRVRGVQTERGDIEADVVVNAGGMYAAEIGRLAGVRVPLVPMAHEYLVTQPFRERDRTSHLPTMRDPDLLIYFREDAGGLVMGGYERHPAPWSLDEAGVDAIPADFNGRLLEEDWERFEEITVNARKRVPVMDEVTITRLINGPEAFTPDGEFLLGESHVRGFFVAAGFCAHGLAGAGGMGKLMAEWIAEGEPSLDVWEMDTRRFGEHYRSPAYTLKRTREVYETYYDIKYPGHERQAGRPLRVSPVYDWHREHGAAFGEKSGWERVNWYEANAADGDEALRPRGWAGQHWSPAIGAEHARHAARPPRCSTRPRSPSWRSAGRARAALLERLCDNRVVRGPGKVTYTQMLNRRGGIECDFTVTQLEEDRFWIVTGTAFGTHDRAWISSHAGDDVLVEDATSRWACLGLWGPRARDILAPCTPDPLDFKYMNYAGDHGRRRAGARAAGDLRRRAGLGALLPDGVRLARCGGRCGRRASRTGWWPAATARSTRCGSRRATACGAPTSRPTTRRTRAALGFAVKLDNDFIGRDALEGAAEPARRLCCVVLADPRSVALGNEPVRAGGEICGRVTSGGYGYTLGASIAYAYLPAEHAEPGTEVAVEVFGEWIDGAVRAEPLFDPEGTRVRG